MIRVLLVLCLTLFAGVAASGTRDAEQYFFDQKMGDFHAELATAKQQGKQGVLLMFELDDCPFCHRMKQTVLNQIDVQNYYHQHFLVFPVDIKSDNPMVDFKGKETTEKKFAAEQRARATPMFAFYDLEGNLVARFTGPTKDAREFMLLGRYVAEGAYKDKSLTFARYKLKQAAQ